MNTNPNSKQEKSNKAERVYVTTGYPLELTPGIFAVTPHGDIIEHPATIKKRNNQTLKKMGLKGLILKHKLRKLGFDMSRWNLNPDLDGTPYSLTLSCWHTTANFRTLAHLTQQHYKTAFAYKQTYFAPRNRLQQQPRKPNHRIHSDQPPIPPLPHHHPPPRNQPIHRNNHHTHQPQNPHHTSHHPTRTHALPQSPQSHPTHPESRNQ